MEYITLGHDHTYILTLNVCIIGDANSHRDLHGKDEVNEQSPELFHTMIPNKYIEQGIMKCLESINPSLVRTKELVLEYAPNHLATYFSPMDSAYCQWDNGNNGKSLFLVHFKSVSLFTYLFLRILKKIHVQTSVQSSKRYHIYSQGYLVIEGPTMCFSPKLFNSQ